MATNVREQRRRRIVERGSDRLALITGQIRNLQDTPPSTPTNLPRHGHSESSPSIIMPHDLGDPEDADHDSAYELQKKMTNNGDSKDKTGKMGGPLLRKCVTSTEATRRPVGDITRTVASEVRTSASKALDQINLFSSKLINYCIIVSEQKRAICAVIIAFLVVISHADTPLLGINIVSSESIILARPVYIILLTDITIVLARLFREKGNGFEEPEEENMAPRDDADNWAGAVMLLERGLVFYQALRGIFIDCSIYAVIVICGLSLM